MKIAFIGGGNMATALIAVYRPAWVTTNDVRRYRLGGPRT